MSPQPQVIPDRTEAAGHHGPPYFFSSLASLRLKVHVHERGEQLGTLVELPDVVNQFTALLPAQVVQRLQTQGIEFDLFVGCAIAHSLLDQSVMMRSPCEVVPLPSRKVEEFRDTIDGFRVEGPANATLHSAELAGVQAQVVRNGLLK